jgi:putative DNA primase/helicase
MDDAVEQFRKAIADAGIRPPPSIIADGRIHRFPTNGNAKDTAGWYVLHDDGVPAGAFGDYRSDLKRKWSAVPESSMTPEQKIWWTGFIDDLKKHAAAEKQIEHSKAADEAEKLWNIARPAPDDFEYLLKKNVKCHGLRWDGERLLVPVRHQQRMMSLQYIDKAGQKKFLRGGQVEGGCFIIGEPKNILYVAEGYATAATIHEATGDPVAVAFNSGNLPPVAKALNSKLPDIEIIVCADDDHRTDGNPGVKKATEAASAIRAKLAIPEFGEHRPDKATDFNDMAAHVGLDRVMECLWKATAPKAESTSAWPEPKPLPDGLLHVSPFDKEMLPEGIAPWVMDISDRMQCPPEYPAVAAMVAIGSIIGRKVGIKPKRQDDWLEVANLWGCLIGRPGFLKSPAMQEALKPLNRLEAKAREANKAALRNYEAECASFKVRKEVAMQCEKDRLRGKKNVPDVQIDDQPEEPRALRYVTNDTTYEKLGAILVANPRGVLVVRDELVSLLRTLDREDQASARGFYLSGWNGTQPYSFDRIIRGHVGLEATCISVLGTTQPGRMAEYIRGVHAGGERDDGLMQRFGMMVWPDEPPSWKDIDRFPETNARDAAWRVFTALDQLNPDELGAQRDEFDSVPSLRFDEAAQSEFRDWRAGLEHRLRSGDMSPALEGHLAKYRKIAPSLALINHVVDGGMGAIGIKPLLRAFAFVTFLEDHARRIYGAGDEIEIAAAKAILNRIRHGDLKDGFSAREIQRNGWSKLSDVQHVKAGLAMLCDLHHIAVVPMPSGPVGGRPTVVYHINPRTVQ